MRSDDLTKEPMPQMNNPEEIPALPAPPEIENAASQAAARDEARPSGAKTARRVLVFIFRLVLFIAVIAALIAAIYFGWPIVYTRYILPVQNNTARLAVLETHQQAGQEQLFALQTQLPALAASQADQSAVGTAQASRLNTLESSIQEHSQALAAAQAGQDAALTALAPRMDTLESFIKEHSRALAALQSTQTSLQAGGASGRAEFEQQVILLKSMELLSRARLFLYQSNFGLAKQDVQTARDLLAGVLAQADHPLDQGLAEVVQRLDQTLSRLPDFPVAASGDLDIAWQILLSGQAQPIVTPIPPAVSENTPTPTPQAPALSETPVSTPTAAP